MVGPAARRQTPRMATHVQDTAAVHTEQPTLAGRNVLVTGGTTGIGRAIAALLVASGANVFIFGRHRPELDEALAALQGGRGRVLGIEADQTQPEAVERVFAELDREFGTLDILVNNAGIAGVQVMDAADREWRYLLNTDLLGAIDCARRAAQRMRARGGGHIINIGSTSAEYPSDGSALYVAAKTGLRGFSKALRAELGGDNIKVTLIEPGMTGSSLFDDEDAEPAVQREKQRRGAMLKAEDVAVAVHYCLTQPSRCTVAMLQLEPRVED